MIIYYFIVIRRYTKHLNTTLHTNIHTKDEYEGKNNFPTTTYIKMNKQKVKKCIVCEKQFTYNEGSKSRSRKNSIGTRPKKSITCSRKCARVYRRVVLRVEARVGK